MLLPLGVLVVKELVTGIMSLLSIRKSGRVDGAVWHGKMTTVLLYSVMTLHLIWIYIPAIVSHIRVGIITGLIGKVTISSFLTNQRISLLMQVMRSVNTANEGFGIP